MGISSKTKEEIRYILATDVGSTTTKARFFTNETGEWRFKVAGESPTTVEAPFEDVTMGVKNSIREVEELTGHRILDEGDLGLITPYDGKGGVDLYVTTSSAGGGLQMMVSGLIGMITAESANRAALGAGAIVMDIISRDDGRKPYEKIRRIRSLRPDMMLIAGGIDGGARAHVLELAELIVAAEPKARLGASYELPIVYAGNKDIQSNIKELMDGSFSLTIVDNIRPVIEVENTGPARTAVHEEFMEHVMSHAPGYLKLMKWVDADIMPTPAGEGIAMQLIADVYKKNLIGVGLGGATTNVYSIFGNRFVRSVSANLGMSYSITNVLKETGIENIIRWIPFSEDKGEISNRLMNKMIRPTTIPQTLEDLIVEHSVAREALRLGLEHHKTIATRLKGVTVDRSIGDVFDQEIEETYIKMMDVDIIAGTGGLLSHAPWRGQTMLILIDAWQPLGITWVFQDSVFMMPHLGVLSTVYRDASWNIFDKDCLVRIGTVIAPESTGNEERLLGEKVMVTEIKLPSGEVLEEEMRFGEIKRVELPEREDANITIYPEKNFDVGAGPGNRLEGIAMGGVVGIIFDTRGRPLQIPKDETKRKETILNWFYSLDLYPKEDLERLL
jgi:uncharacterized protein (TIGR01319 family)